MEAVALMEIVILCEEDFAICGISGHSKQAFRPFVPYLGFQRTMDRKAHEHGRLRAVCWLFETFEAVYLLPALNASFHVFSYAIDRVAAP